MVAAARLLPVVLVVVLVVVLAVLVVLAVVARSMLSRLESWFPERWRATSRATFDCQLPAAVVMQRLLARAHAQRGWLVESATPYALRIRAGTTFYAWRKRIEASVQASTDVTSTVSIVSSSPQIYDWGDNRRAVEVLRSSVAEAIWQF